jgi:hypothetical protein
MQSHVPVPPPISMTPAAWLRPAISVIAVLVMAFTALGLAGVAPLLAGGIADGASVGAMAAVVGVAFVRTPEFGARRQRKRKRVLARDQRKEHQSEVAGGKKLLARLIDDGKKLDAESERAAAKRAKQREAELQKIQRGRQSRQARIAKRRNDIAASQAREIASALKRIQASVYQSEMSRYHIASAGVRGIGPALSAALARYGIVTAADFSGSGRVQQVPGIGPAKAQALEAWRQGVVAHVNRRLPTSLSATDRAAIEARYRAQLQSLVQEEQQAHAEGDREIAAANARYQVQEAEALADARQAVAELDGRRLQTEATLQQAEVVLRDTEVFVSQTEHEMMPYRNITWTRFVARIVRGPDGTV